VTVASGLALALSGVGAGLLAGLLGIGGGVLLVPLLVSWGYVPVRAVATSSLAIVVISLSGSLQNWRMGELSWRSALALGVPAAIAAQGGAWAAERLASAVLLAAFGALLLANIYLMGLRRRLASASASPAVIAPRASRLGTGGIAGFMAGLFGVGGGVVLVPLQVLLLGESIKTAVRASLGAVAIATTSACLGHAQAGNVALLPGLLLGAGGLAGAQVSTRLLPRLPDRAVALLFRGLMAGLAATVFWQAWREGGMP